MSVILWEQMDNKLKKVADNDFYNVYHHNVFIGFNRIINSLAKLAVRRNLKSPILTSIIKYTPELI